MLIATIEKGDDQAQATDPDEPSVSARKTHPVSILSAQENALGCSSIFVGPKVKHLLFERKEGARISTGGLYGSISHREKTTLYGDLTEWGSGGLLHSVLSP